MQMKKPTYFVLEDADGRYNEFSSAGEAREYFIERIEMYEDANKDPRQIKMGLVMFSGYVPHEIPEEL